jgi:uncharacterized membrane protein
MDWLELLRFLNLFCAGIGAGGLLMSFVVMVPAKRRLPPCVWIELHRVVGPLVDAFLPYAVVSSGVAALLLLRLQPAVSMGALVLGTAGLAGTLGVCIASIRFNQPMNRLIAGGSIEADAGSSGTLDHPLLRQWERAHGVRAALCVLALACYTVANLVL